MTSELDGIDLQLLLPELIMTIGLAAIIIVLTWATPSSGSP